MMDKDPSAPAHRKSYRIRCLSVFLLSFFLILVSLVVVFLILYLTVLRPHDPTTTLLSANITGFSPRLVTAPTLKVDINISFSLSALVRNPNHATFEYNTGQSVLLYRGNQVGQATVEPGRVPSHGSSVIRLELSVESDRFTNQLGSLLGDVIAGEIEFDADTTVPGRVTVF